MHFPEEKQTKKEHDFIPLSEAAKIIGYTPEYLNLLCRKKQLRASKIGRNWHTTSEWLADFLETRSETDANKKNFTETEAVLSDVSKDENEYHENLYKARTGLLQIRNGFLKKNIIAGALAFGCIMAINLAVNISQKYNEAQAYDNYTFTAAPNEIEGVMVKGEEIVNDEQLAFKAGVLASENYKVANVSFGGDVMMLTDDHGDAKLEISDVRSETLTSKDQKENKLLLTWKTSKQAISEITYSKNNGQGEKTLQETDYGVTHSIILPDLEPSTSYMYKISCKDKWGNKITTDRFGAYIGAKPVSVFELIAKNFSEMFEWANKK